MAYYFNDPAALSLTNGTVCTPANSGGAAGTAFSSVTGNVTFQSGRWRFTGAGAVAQATWSLPGVNQFSWVGKFAGAAAPSGGDSRLLGFWNGASSTLRVEVNAARRLVVYDASGARYTTPSGVVAPTTGSFRVHLGGTISGTAAQIRLAFWADGDSTGAADATYTLSAGNTGTVPWSDVRFGRVNSTPTATYELAYAHARDDQFTDLGPFTGAPPVVSLGDAQTVEPLTTVTLTAAHIAGAAPSSWAWEVLAGGVTLTGSGASRQFVAPPTMTGTTVRVGCTPTGSGKTGTRAEVDITVLPHLVWVRIPGTGGTWQPTQAPLAPRL